MFKSGRVKQILAALSLCLLSALAYTPTVTAGPQQSNSTNYGVSEVNFGSGGELHACSTTYCSKQTAGDLAVGETNSTSYKAFAGSDTDRSEVLEFSVASGGINLGVLDSTAAKFGSTTFSIRTFPAYGYSVVVAGNAPKLSSGYTIASMSSATTSNPGNEQFGINLKQNTSPSVGAEAVQFPDNTFAFGVASSGYDTQNNFKFVSGDTVAQSPKGYGQTNYTLSALVNVSPNTPGGSYAGTLALIAVPTF
jgi:hypothetical protein